MIAVAISDWLPSLLQTLFGGGVVAAITAAYKLRPEAGQIVVTAAQGALLVQTGVIENLQKEIVRLTEELRQIKVENQDLRNRVDGLLKNQVRHDGEIKDLSVPH